MAARSISMPGHSPVDSSHSCQVLRKVLIDQKRSTKGMDYKSNESNKRNIMVDGSLEQLLEVHERESIEELLAKAFKDLRECQKSLDSMKAGKASTPPAELSVGSGAPGGERNSEYRCQHRNPWTKANWPLPKVQKTTRKTTWRTQTSATPFAIS